MTIKSLLLGAAAGIAAIGAAQAADLPMTKGEAVEYVKVCSAFGPGFFYIPGSDTCLKIGGEIRADYRAFGSGGDAKFGRDDNRSAFNTQARIWFDARTQTDWGLLRSYFQIDADSHPINRSSSLDTAGNTFSIDKAFIQFGGLTAGYAHSFFGFYDNEYGDTIWAPYYAESSTVNLIAYTAQFGGGFSATLSIEDGRDHRDTNTGLSGSGVDGAGNTVALTAGSLDGGQQLPDVVAQLRYDADWGSLAVQGALHQNRTADDLTLTQTTTTPAGVVTTATTSLPINHDNKWGYAVGGTALFKIPMIDGGHFIVEGQYADGAIQYLGASAAGGGGVLGAPIGDLFVSGATGVGLDVDRSKGWSIVAELGGNITPVLNANLVGSYIDVKSDDFLATSFDTSFKEYTITGNLTYTIVKGLSVGGEVSYTHQKVDNGINIVSGTVGDTSANVWQAGIRLKRTF